MQRNQFIKRGGYSSLLWPALIVLLSACETAQVGTGHMGTSHMGITHLELPAIEPTELMFVDDASDASTGPWEGASTVINDEAKLRGRLKPYSNNPNGPENIPIGLLIKDVKNKNANAGNSGTNPFKGLGGGYYHTLLRAAEGKVDPSTEEYDPTNVSTIELSGRITDYSFSRTGNPNDNKGKGTLTVDTYQTVKHGIQVVEIHNYVWDIEINPNGYKIQEIVPLVDDPNVPNEEELEAWDPFPETLFFPKEVKERILYKGYNVKLHASGTGAIKINSVFKDGFEITNSDANFRPLLHPDKDSCVDIFLKLPDADNDGRPDDLNDIPTEYEDLIKDFFYSYCLGRCADPAIINSR